MDETTYRDALLRKQGELLGGSAAKPLKSLPNAPPKGRAKAKAPVA